MTRRRPSVRAASSGPAAWRGRDVTAARVPGLILAAALAAMLAAALAGPARAADTPAACPSLQEVAEGVYLLPALGTAPTPANGGRTGNSTVLVGPKGITVIDPGPTLRAGRALRCAIDRVSPLPVVALVVSHAHPQHTLASGAFPGTPIYATTATAESMRQRCPACRERLEKAIGRDAMAGTDPAIPDRTVDAETSLAPGGRTIRLLPLGPAHAQGDLAVLDEATGTLMASDLANAEGIPEFADGSVAGATAALRRLAARPGVRRVVPGQGVPYAPPRLRHVLEYMEVLADIAGREVAAGNMTPPDPTPAILLRWGDDRTRHSLNLQMAMREAEERWWAPPAPPAPDARTREPAR